MDRQRRPRRRTAREERAIREIQEATGWTRSPWSKTCKKRAYPDEGTAVSAATRLALRTGRVWRAYGDCGCGSWHLTTRPEWEPR